MPFHFCGLVLDMVRSCYYSHMRLWKDSDELTLGRWVASHPDARAYTDMCSFRSWHTWLRGETNSGVGEQTDGNYPYHNGMDPIGYRGQRLCGSRQAVLGGGMHGRDQEIQLAADGTTPCCGPFGPVGYLNCISGIQFGPALRFTYFGINVVGRAGYMWLHRYKPAGPAADVIAGWTQLATVTAHAGKHRLTLYRRWWNGLEPASFDVPVPAGEACAGIIVSVNPFTAVVEHWQPEARTGSPWALPRVFAGGHDRLLLLGESTLLPASFSGGLFPPFICGGGFPGSLTQSNHVLTPVEPGLTPAYSRNLTGGVSEGFVYALLLAPE